MRLNPKTWLLLVALAAVALYLPTLGYDFVYDSVTQIGADDFIHQPRHFLDVLTLRVLGMDVLDFNRPVNLFTLMVDSLLWGKNPAGYRLTSMLLHGAAAAMLFRWLRIITGKLWPALLATLWFLAHPLHTETVVEVGYREDLLATLFLLVGLNAAAAFQPGERGKTWLPALIAFAGFFLSAASKESGVAGPMLLIAYWWLFQRENRHGRKAWLILITATTLAVGAFFVLRFYLEPNPSIIFESKPSPIASTPLDWMWIQVQIWSGEILRIIWPSGLCAEYGPYMLRDMDRHLALAGVLLVIVAQAVFSIWNRKIALASLLFWSALAPVSNIIPIYHPMADRYLYTPMAGVALLLAMRLSAIRQKETRVLTNTLALAAIAGLAVATLVQQSYWKDAAALWKRTAGQNPLSYNAWLGWGYACLDNNDPAQAIERFLQASEVAHGKMAEPFAGIALAEDALANRRLAGIALSRATKLDSRFARPETLVRALILPDYRAQRLALIARRASPP